MNVYYCKSLKVTDYIVMLVQEEYQIVHPTYTSLLVFNGYIGVVDENETECLLLHMPLGR